MFPVIAQTYSTVCDVDDTNINNPEKNEGQGSRPSLQLQFLPMMPNVINEKNYLFFWFVSITFFFFFWLRYVAWRSFNVSTEVRTSLPLVVLCNSFNIFPVYARRKQPHHFNSLDFIL